jgi:glycosyltransferase involved in cell wall biosynthesis
LKPLVSINVITYGHSEFIEQAINSLLSQQTNFPYEIVIGEDCGPDDTREICERLAAEHPDQIRLLPSDRNYGIAANFFRVLRACKGKFVAICEGDDYWTDHEKLQKQVDFLRSAGKEYIGHAHNVQIVGLGYDKKFSARPTRDLTTIDLVGARQFHTASLMFDLDKFGNHYPPDSILSADKSLFVALSLKGKIRYSDEVMGIYRKNEGGISRNVTYQQLEGDLNLLPYLDSFGTFYPRRELKAMTYSSIVKYATNHSLGSILRHYLNFILASINMEAFNPVRILKLGQYVAHEGVP